MQPKIAEAFYKKFDAAALLNTDNPFPQSLEESVVAAANVIKGPLTYDNILALEDALGKMNLNQMRSSQIVKTAQNCVLPLKQSVQTLNLSMTARRIRLMVFLWLT